MLYGLSTVRSRCYSCVKGIACDVCGDEAIPAQPVHEAASEGGYGSFLYVSLSIIFVSFRVSASYVSTFHFITFLNCTVRKRVTDDFLFEQEF